MREVYGHNYTDSHNSKIEITVDFTYTVMANVKGQPLFLLTVMVQNVLPTGLEVGLNIGLL